MSTELPTLYVHPDYLDGEWKDAGHDDLTAWLVASEDSECVPYVPAAALAAVTAERDAANEARLTECALCASKLVSARGRLICLNCTSSMGDGPVEAYNEAKANAALREQVASAERWRAAAIQATAAANERADKAERERDEAQLTGRIANQHLGDLMRERAEVARLVAYNKDIITESSRFAAERDAGLAAKAASEARVAALLDEAAKRVESLPVQRISVNYQDGDYLLRADVLAAIGGK